MKRVVAIWNRLPGVQAVNRFTYRKTAIARIWRAIQPQTEVDCTTARPRHKTAQRQPVFREGSKAAQVLTLLCRAEGATLNEIRNQTGWQAHTVRGFISRSLSRQSRKVRSFERDGKRVYRKNVTTWAHRCEPVKRERNSWIWRVPVDERRDTAEAAFGDAIAAPHGFGKEEQCVLNRGRQVREHQDLAHARPAGVPGCANCE
jgi:uncharacterized protein DUF3489